jgi:hypothetical protein
MNEFTPMLPRMDAKGNNPTQMIKAQAMTPKECPAYILDLRGEGKRSEQTPNLRRWYQTKKVEK